jgi:hypothetical protein
MNEVKIINEIKFVLVYFIFYIQTRYIGYSRWSRIKLTILGLLVVFCFWIDIISMQGITYKNSKK